MTLDDIGPLYARIGQIIVDSLGPLQNRLLLYVNYDAGDVARTIAEDRGDHLYFHVLPDADESELVEAVRALWEAEPGPEHWVDMSYIIENGEFHAKLLYADHLDPAESLVDRLIRMPNELFGNKSARSASFPEDSADGYSFEY